MKFWQFLFAIAFSGALVFGYLFDSVLAAVIGAIACAGFALLDALTGGWE